MRIRKIFLLVLMLLTLNSTTVFALESKMELTLQSSAFNENDSIPSKYTCTGEDISPPLNWQHTPDKTISFVLIMDDPDAPAGTWDHWIVFNIPNTTVDLPENMSSLPQNASYGKNGWGNQAYGGPCPPSGEHRYVFKLYALDMLLNLEAGATKSQIEKAMQGHILATATLLGKYKK